ncbi:glycerophosphodiester phosphodiesterase [Poriferisphaera sp. WC338]|uniref:glycerophosphodiester phosphodiesterase n=1 Tax=Poriferisphaera sp. WC338 TaxID=3425129 RepID=UPI003D81B338
MASSTDRPTSGSSVNQQSLIIAHRGASHDAPENTLAAFKLAWEKDADGVELDVHMTSDGKLIVSHDEDTKRTAGVEHKIQATPLATLQKLDVGSWKDEKYAGEKMPTLAEVLAVIPKGKLVYIEIKVGADVVSKVKEDIEGSGINPSQVRVISFNPEAVKESREQMPDIKAYLLLSFGSKQVKEAGGLTSEGVIDELKRTKANGVDLNDSKTVTPKFVDAIKDAGFEYHVWTVNDPEIAEKYEKLGVDSITTDRPAFIRDALNEDASAATQPAS